MLRPMTDSAGKPLDHIGQTIMYTHPDIVNDDQFNEIIELIKAAYHKDFNRSLTIKSVVELLTIYYESKKLIPISNYEFNFIIGFMASSLEERNDYEAFDLIFIRNHRNRLRALKQLIITNYSWLNQDLKTSVHAGEIMGKPHHDFDKLLTDGLISKEDLQRFINYGLDIELIHTSMSENKDKYGHIIYPYVDNQKTLLDSIAKLKL